MLSRYLNNLGKRWELVLCLFSGLLLVGSSILYAQADDYYRLQTYGSYDTERYAQINKHGTCRSVFAAAQSNDLFVPIKTAGEWASFYNYYGDSWGPISGRQGCSSCAPIISNRGINGCSSVDRRTTGAWYYPWLCSELCSSLGGNACSFLSGGGDAGCWVGYGASCAYYYHPAWMGRDNCGDAPVIY